MHSIRTDIKIPFAHQPERAFGGTEQQRQRLTLYIHFVPRFGVRSVEGGDLDVQTFSFLFPQKGEAAGGLRHLGSVAGADGDCPLSSASDPELDKKKITAHQPSRAVIL